MLLLAEIYTEIKKYSSLKHYKALKKQKHGFSQITKIIQNNYEHQTRTRKLEKEGEIFRHDF